MIGLGVQAYRVQILREGALLLLEFAQLRHAQAGELVLLLIDCAKRNC
jgi:hypothetical protein